jgi:ribosomal-protein-alanine N-acetyltransferase
MTWTLRTAGVPDLDAIMHIESSVFASDAWSRDTMRAELASGHTYYLAAERDGALEGYAGLNAPRGSSQADIQTIAVVPEARRGGLGRSLMTALIAEAGSRGARQLFLEVRADNPGAHALYVSLGFEEIAIRTGYYQPDNVDAHVLRLEIGSPLPAVGA